jgi:hypothetical protein
MILTIGTLSIAYTKLRRVHKFSISIVAPFSGLRRFPQGRGFKQWTGDDSKALMKVSDQRVYLLKHILIPLGLPSGYSRPCPSGHGEDVLCLLGVLLYCTT